MIDVVILGAGASGLMCASVLKKYNNNLKVLLLEKNDKVGKKLAITGNGRCNLGNKDKSILNYNSTSSLDNFKNKLESKKYLDYLKEFGIYIKEENNLLYPNSNQAISVVKSFERYLISKNINIKYSYNVSKIEKENDIFIINDDIKCKNVIVATGGKTYEKTGSNGSGYDLLKKYHTISNIYPSLVPLISNYKYLKELKGVRVDACASLIVNNNIIDKEEGQIQFTEYGLSGICIFNLSRNVKRYINEKKKVYIIINLAPNIKKEDLIPYINSFSNYKIEDALSNIFNNKVSYVISKDLGILGKIVMDLNINNIVNKIYDFKFEIIDTKDFNNAQVTSGGVLISEFDNNLESLKCNGLYAIGEVLDVDGKCGGYNLAWAFTSALLAANSVIKKLK